MENKILDISIVIPVYNSSMTIKECIDSVISEMISIDYSWELVLINDGSSDNSEYILNEYKNKSKYHENIIIINQINSGAAAARNTGIKNSRGKIIGFNDSDDIWIKGKMKKQIDFIEKNPNVDMIGGVHEFDSIPCYFRKISDVNVINIKDMIFKNYFTPQNVLIKRDILDKTSLFDETMRSGGEEGSLFYLLTAIGQCILLNIKMSASISGKKTWGESGLSSNLWGMEKGVLYNKIQAYKMGLIPLYLFLISFIFSLIKFLRRLIIKSFR